MTNVINKKKGVMLEKALEEGPLVEIRLQKISNSRNEKDNGVMDDNRVEPRCMEGHNT